MTTHEDLQVALAECARRRAENEQLRASRITRWVHGLRAWSSTAQIRVEGFAPDHVQAIRDHLAKSAREGGLKIEVLEGSLPIYAYSWAYALAVATCAGLLSGMATGDFHIAVACAGGGLGNEIGRRFVNWRRNR
uniref:Uncharacterized protein n=1 Tax=uncultured Caudovirales phage TaxID=2100421 RepID=A0A6J5KZS0_9CAUD|nr:hypothetical protein UFOVP114_5 [uncultured Caudovirales phage]